MRTAEYFGYKNRYANRFQENEFGVRAIKENRKIGSGEMVSLVQSATKRSA